jgi:hypothetical protein
MKEDKCKRDPRGSGLTKAEAMKAYWREVKAGRRERNEKSLKNIKPKHNPIFDLPEEIRAKLFVWLRECPYHDAVRKMLLRDHGMGGFTDKQFDDFFAGEAENHWYRRITRAAEEANALVKLAEEHVPKFSAGMLAALGQEAFRQVTKGDADPATMGRLASLFMKARGDERQDQMQELKREQLRHELQDQIEHALEKLAEEVERHPEAKEAFDALRRELAEHKGEGA